MTLMMLAETIFLMPGRGVSLDSYTPPDHDSIDGKRDIVPMIRSLLKVRISNVSLRNRCASLYKKIYDITTSLLIESFKFNVEYKDIQMCVTQGLRMIQHMKA